MTIPRVERKQFKIGKYDVIAQPMFGSAHMLRYTVHLYGKRIGTLASMPTESDCRLMETPQVVPPLKPFVYYRPGRPKKGSTFAATEVRHPSIGREDLPLDALPSHSRWTKD